MSNESTLLEKANITWQFSVQFQYKNLKDIASFFKYLSLLKYLMLKDSFDWWLRLVVSRWQEVDGLTHSTFSSTLNSVGLSQGVENGKMVVTLPTAIFFWAVSSSTKLGSGLAWVALAFGSEGQGGQAEAWGCVWVAHFWKAGSKKW